MFTNAVAAVCVGGGEGTVTSNQLSMKTTTKRQHIFSWSVIATPLADCLSLTL